MSTFKVTKTWPNAAKIEQLPAVRNWMDETVEKHAYMCLPVLTSNRLGWGISFPEDISFMWNGSTDPSPEHVTVLKGEQYVDTKRGNATVSFRSGLIFKTDELTTTLTMPVPNLFVRGVQCYTTLISTSFYLPELPIAWRITEPNIEITIPAGQPVAAVLPISLVGLQNDYTLEISDEYPSREYWDSVRKQSEIVNTKNTTGQWSNMYRDAVDSSGNIVGAHELKSLKLKTVVCPHTGASYEVEDVH